jgi:hypothetical protein
MGGCCSRSSFWWHHVSIQLEHTSFYFFKCFPTFCPKEKLLKLGTLVKKMIPILGCGNGYKFTGRNGQNHRPTF